MGRLKLGEISLKPTSQLGSKSNAQAPAPQPSTQSSVPPTGKIATGKTRLPMGTSVEKKKKLTKEQLEQMSNALIDEYLNLRSIEEAAKCFEDMKTPKYSGKFCTKAIMIVLDRKESDRIGICELMKAFCDREMLTSDQLVESIEQVLPQIPDLVIDVPKVEEYMSGMIAMWIKEDLLSVETIVAVFCPGYESYHAVIFSTIFQQLKASKGKEWVEEVFKANNIDLRESLMKEHRNEENLSKLLNNAGLKFLYPMLCLKDDLFGQLTKHIPTAVKDIEQEYVKSGVRAIFKWLQSLDAALQSAPAFIRTIGFCIVAHVTRLSTLSVSNPTPEAKKLLKVDEKTSLQALAAILNKYVSENVQKQVDLIYALQSFCHEMKFPKGMMLR